MENIVSNLDQSLSQYLRHKNIKVESYSGGATKIPFLAGAGIGIREQNPNYNPDLIVGISSGACTALMLALGKTEELREIVLHLQLSTFFSRSPVNKEGKITIEAPISGLLTGSLGSMGNLRKLIRKNISEKEYKIYKDNQYAPAVLIGITSLTTNNCFKLINLKQTSYERMIDVIVASASIPVYSEAVEMDGEYYYDGGLMYHNAGRIVLEYLNERVSSYISVYSRPEIDNTKDHKFNGRNLMRTVSKTVDQLQRGLSINDAKDEIKLSKQYQIKYFQQVYSENIMKGLYDVDSKRLLELYNLGRERTNHISI